MRGNFSDYELASGSFYARHDWRNKRFCQFGLTELVIPLLVSAGLSASTAAIAAPALIGAGLGAGGSALTGGDPLTGALTGGLTAGGTSAFGSSLGTSLGIGTTAADALIGAGSGALSAGITGQDPLSGTISGGIGGLTTGLNATGSFDGLLGGPAGSGGSNIVGLGADGLGGTGALSGGDFVGAATTGGLPGGSSAFGTSTPVGGGGAVGSSLTGGGGAIPGGSLGTDLTSNFGEGGISGGMDAGLGAANGSNIASGLPTGGGIVGLGADGLGGAGGLSGGGASAAAAAPAAAGGKGIWGTGLTGGDVLSGGILGYSALKQQSSLDKMQAPLQANAQATAAQTKLANDQAAQLQTQSQQLAAPLTSGAPLPAGAQATIDNQAKAAKAKVMSTYASLGLSGSTMEQQALGQVDAQVAQQMFSVQQGLYQDAQTAQTSAQNLLRLGQTGTQQNNQLYESILNTQLQQDQNLSSAISNFAKQMLGTPSNSSGTQPVAA